MGGKPGPIQLNLMTPTQIGKLKQKHYDDRKSVLSKLRCLDKGGQIRQWKGREFFQEMEKLGHDSFGMEQCKCMKE